MNTNPNHSQSEPGAHRFLSMSAFRTAHSNLLHKHHDHGDSSELFVEIQEFIMSGRVLGELLDSSEDRWVAQGMLDYWATVLFRASYDPLDVTLYEFDPNQAPNLDPLLCPYRGLDAFQEDDKERFFGRQQVINDLVEKIQENRLICVVGSSGSGKSSLIRAGLLPLLKQGEVLGSQDWNYYPTFVPGANPLESLIDAIHPPKTDREKWINKQVKALQEDSGRLINLIAELGLDVPTMLVIDQFEEIFTLCTDESLRQAFINNLSEFVETKIIRHTVVLTMRVDFLEHLSQFSSFESLFRQNMIILRPPNPVELRETIEEPANLIMLKFEDGVVDALIEDVQNDRAPLPLLQFALLKLWDNKERNRITWKAYKDLGGAHGALPRTADKLYGELNSEDRYAVRYILVKLSRQPQKGQEVTRDRLSLTSVYEDGPARDRIEWMLNKLVAAHLVRWVNGDTEEETLVEIAHEALVRNWEPLRQWLVEDQVFLIQRTRLAEAAEEWDASSRDLSMLWKGSRLDDASAYKDLSPLEAKFIQAGKDAEKAEYEREIAQRVERETAERLRKINQELEMALSQAKLERDRAEKQARLASSRELALVAIDNLTVDPERSVLLGTHAALLTHSAGEGVAPEVESALHRAVMESRTVLTLSGHKDQVRSVAFSPDGTQIATASQDNTIKIWDSILGRELSTLIGHEEGVLDITFSSSGTYFATASRDKTAKVWLVSSGETIGKFKHEKEILSVAFSPNELRLVTGSADATAIVWDLTSGKIIHVLDDHNGGINRVVFSPDGTRIATASRDRTVKIWDVKSGELLGNLIDRDLDSKSAHASEVIDVVFSPDGKYLVTAGWDNVKVWSNQRPRDIVRKPLDGHKSWVESVVFSPDGKRLATGSQDGTAKIWDFGDLEAGRELITLSGHTNRIYKVAFSPDGDRLVTAGRDGVAKVWNITLQQEVFSFWGHENEITSISYNPDGTQLATTSMDKTAKIWDTETKQLLHTLTAHNEPVFNASFSPDGNYLATASLDNRVIIWSTKSGEVLHTLPIHRNSSYDVTFSPNGKLLAAACKDGNVKIWDTDTFALVKELKHTEAVYGIVFSPLDGRYIATVSEDNTARIWDCLSGEQMTANQKHVSTVRCIAFSPDGTCLVTGSYDKSAMVWDSTNGKVIHTLLGHTQGVVDVLFSFGGERVITASDDGTIKLWDMGTGQELMTLFSHTNKIKSISISPNGMRLASADQEGGVYVHALSINELLELAHERTTRSLRPEEWQKYIHTENLPPTMFDIGVSKATAMWLIVRGKNLARGGDVTGAISNFEKARNFDPSVVDFDPELEAQRLANSIFGR